MAREAAAAAAVSMASLKEGDGDDRGSSSSTKTEDDDDDEEDNDVGARLEEGKAVKPATIGQGGQGNGSDDVEVKTSRE
jgi:hypothetical protein